MSVDLRVADKDMLKDTITQMGYTFNEGTNGELIVHIPGGNLTISNDKVETYNPRGTSIINDLKQKFANNAITKVAKKYKFVQSIQGQNKIRLRRY